MTVRSVATSPGDLSMTVTADFAAPADRVWQMWADPRLLERWWGPPTWPATFTEHDFVVGGRARYHMTGPDGARANGWWVFEGIDAPHAIAIRDGFADDAGEPDPQMPEMAFRVALDRTGATTTMTITGVFASLEQMDQVLAMGAVEGMTLAVGQIDQLLAG